MIRRELMIICCISLLLLLSGCAGRNELTGTYDENGGIAGFWHGLWHGFISPITLLISLFDRRIGMYEVHNTGFGYNFGFLFGLSSWHLGNVARNTLYIFFMCKIMDVYKDISKKRC